MFSHTLLSNYRERNPVEFDPRDMCLVIITKNLVRSLACNVSSRLFAAAAAASLTSSALIQVSFSIRSPFFHLGQNKGNFCTGAYESGQTWASLCWGLYWPWLLVVWAFLTLHWGQNCWPSYREELWFWQISISTYWQLTLSSKKILALKRVAKG